MGHEFSYFRAGSVSSRMRPNDFPVSVLKSAKIFHVSGISLAILDTAADTVFAAIQSVKEAGGMVSYDTNLRLKLWPIDRAWNVIHASMEKCDIALAGIDDAEQIAGLSDTDDIADFYLKLGAKIVGLTLGSEGTLVATPDRCERVKGRQDVAVDATVAADTFDGALLPRFVAGDGPFQPARYANAAAPLSTQGYGAIAPMPGRDAVEAFFGE